MGRPAGGTGADESGVIRKIRRGGTRVRFPLIAQNAMSGAPGFGEELEKLMSVSMPLKVGITSGSEKQTRNLEKQIRTFFKSWHPSIRQADRSEYLFLVRFKEGKQYSWRYISFTGSDGTRMKPFQNTGKTFDFGR